MKGLGLDDEEVVMNGLVGFVELAEAEGGLNVETDDDEGRKTLDTGASMGFVAFEPNGLDDC